MSCETLETARSSGFEPGGYNAWSWLLETQFRAEIGRPLLAAQLAVGETKRRHVTGSAGAASRSARLAFEAASRRRHSGGRRTLPRPLRAACRGFLARVSLPRQKLFSKFAKHPREPIPIGYVQLPQLFEMRQDSFRRRGVIPKFFKPCYERPLVRDELIGRSDVVLCLIQVLP